MNISNKLFILGPCSAESEEQVLQTAAAIRSVAPASCVFRAGVWKPRTNPQTFQGAGEVALTWLSKTGLPTATEVATKEHVEKAIAAGIRYLWIGARTSANPIAVQEIADSLSAALPPKGEQLTILIKNPVNEDVELWLGNIKRIEKAVGSDHRVMAIHRGCGHKPCWRMVFDLRRRRPDIPILLDPSHLSGDKSKVAALAIEAMLLHFDGLMIEVHTEPENALSDGKQQITPEQLGQLLTELTEKEDAVSNMDSEDKQSITDLPLRELRKEMDEVDEELWSVMAKRMDVSRRIGDYKKTCGMPIIQPNRYEQILQRRLAWAQENGLSQEATRQIMDIIHKESVRVQQ